MAVDKTCLRRIISQIESGVIKCNCHQACSEDLYKTSLTAGAINTKFFSFIKSIKTLEKVNNETYTASFPRDSRTILGLKVYYRTLLLRTVLERPAYSWETLVANIGGNLGFFMGLTLITFFEIFEFFCDIILAFIKYR
ncbi:degenerin unc-8-like [Uloborus diversus]|uniref:degenerin unc-8-like n=1 Tax=Uloborus diversus TaxID=327109 RepID=UPI00240A18C7|nr:degenerin unc-8-like [Uloborus diversus]